MPLSRRSFIRIIGGGVVFAAAAGVAATQVGHMPEEAIAGWNGPTEGESDPRIRALSYALLAPNPHNRQPWLVDLRTPEVIDLYVDRDRLLPHTDPYSRQIVIGHGTFLELLVVAATATGHRAEVRYLPDGPFPDQKIGTGRIASIRLIKDETLKPDPLFAAIPNRRSNKEPYDLSRPIEKTDADSLIASGFDSVAQLDLAVDGAVRDSLRTLAQDAFEIEVRTPRTLQESIDLMRIGPAEIAEHRDGLDFAGPMFYWLKQVGMMDREEMARPGSTAFNQSLTIYKELHDNTAGFGWLTTAGNDRETQLRSGRAYARLNLTATAVGLSMHPVSQALQEYPEMDATQARLRQLLKTPDGATIQMLFRLGYAATPGPSPRRDLRDIIRA